LVGSSAGGIMQWGGRRWPATCWRWAESLRLPVRAPSPGTGSGPPVRETDCGMSMERISAARDRGLQYGLYGPLAIFGGTANPELAQEVARCLGKPLGGVTIYQYDNQNIFAKLNESVRGKDVFLIQPTCPGSRTRRLRTGECQVPGGTGAQLTDASCPCPACRALVRMLRQGTAMRSCWCPAALAARRAQRTTSPPVSNLPSGFSGSHFVQADIGARAGVTSVL